MRKCPNCNKELIYRSARSYQSAVKKNVKCTSCVQRGKVPANRLHFGPLVRTCPSCRRNITYTNRTSFLLAHRKNGECKECSCQRVKSHLTQRGQKRSDMSIKKFQETVKRTGILFQRPIPTDETKAKIRTSKIKRYEKQGTLFHGCVNPTATAYIMDLNSSMGWNLQHAENGGEFIVHGYHLDGYDKDKNIAFEYDEPHHYSCNVLRHKDVIRQNRIINLLKCRLWRYDEKRDRLYEVTQPTEPPRSNPHHARGST